MYVDIDRYNSEQNICFSISEALVHTKEHYKVNVFACTGAYLSGWLIGE